VAIIKFGTLVVGVRGTVGGVTYSANGSGPHARIWGKGSNPRSGYQETVRGHMTRYGALWAGMSSALRQDWRAFAAAPPEDDYNSLGEQYWLNGFNWFCRVNQRRASVALATTTTVPASSAATAPASVTLTFSQLPAGSCVVAWPAATFGAGTSAFLFLAAHMTVGVAAMDSQFVLVYSVRNPPNTGATITSLVSARFGNIRTGWSFFGRLYLVRDDGVRSTPAMGWCEVT